MGYNKDKKMKRANHQEQINTAMQIRVPWNNRNNTLEQLKEFLCQK